MVGKKAKSHKNIFSGLKENRTRQVTIGSCWQLLKWSTVCCLALRGACQYQNPVVNSV